MKNKQTAVELLHKESNELITKYLDGKIDARELITMHHNILYPHKEMEKEQIIDAYYQCGRDNFEHIKVINRSATDYYNETYE